MQLDSDKHVIRRIRRTFIIIATGILLQYYSPSAFAASYANLFVGSPYQRDGEAGCKDPYNGDWQTYTDTTVQNAITLTAGRDCRTVNTKTNNACVFDLGHSGVTEIDFDFSISDSCHLSPDNPTDWLAFWVYTEQPSGWRNTAEVDFIESQNGPIPGGLNSNFAGTGNQVGIFYPDDPNWHGHIQALFSNDPEDPTKIDTSISNSYNNNVATTTLTYNQGYFFVLDTTPTC